MLKDFTASDLTTLRCTKVSGVTEINAASLQLGPLVELLTFGRRSLPRVAELSFVETDCRLFTAIAMMPPDSAWAYKTIDGVGALRVRAGKPNVNDDVVQQQFLMDIRVRLEQHGVPITAAKALTGAAGELIDNIGEHAGSDAQAIAAFDISQGSLWLSMGDCGKGVLATYNSMPDIQNSSQALNAAVIKNRSSTGDSARGNGFKSVLRALQNMDASVRVRSDNASVEYEGMAGSGRWFEREQTHLRGFVVSAHIRWNHRS